jgi:hypothetical protein
LIIFSPQTEDAAQNLENGVFNGRLDLASTVSAAPLTSSLPAPSLAAQPPPLITRPSQPAPSSTARFGAPPLELTTALTSIVALPLPHGDALSANLGCDFDATPAEITAARREEVERILKVLPDREVTEFLAERYFESVAWLFNHLHAPTYAFLLLSTTSACTDESPP